MTQNNSIPRAYWREDVARISKRSPELIRNWAQGGRIPAKKVYGVWVFPHAVFEAIARIPTRTALARKVSPATRRRRAA